MSTIKTLILAALAAVGASVFAEDAVLCQPVLLRSDHNAVSIKTGATVEVLSRNGNMATIKYRGVTGAVLASKLSEPGTAVAQEAAAVIAPAPKPANPAPTSAVATKPAAAPQPQTTYGREVALARANESKHEDILAKPADDILKEQ